MRVRKVTEGAYHVIPFDRTARGRSGKAGVGVFVQDARRYSRMVEMFALVRGQDGWTRI